MRNFFVSLLALGLAACASKAPAPNAHFVDRGYFNNSPFVTATAAKPEDAKKHALALIPKGFSVDMDLPAPIVSCGTVGEEPTRDASPDGKVLGCASGLYRVDVPLLPDTGTEREAILKSRAAVSDALERNEPKPE